MIGFNGGRIGKENLSAAQKSVPGVWSAREQEVALRAGRWPLGNPPPLDIYPNAAIAYGLRVLRTAAASNAVVRVRRSSDNTEQDFTAFQVIDGSLTSFCGAGDGFVRTWYDQSGNSNHATQTDTSKQPRIVNNGTLEQESSKPAIVYPSSSHNLKFTTRLTTIRSYFLLAKCTNTSQSAIPFLLGDAFVYDFHAGDAGPPYAWLSSQFSSQRVRFGNTRLNGTVAALESTNRSTSRLLFTIITTDVVAGSQLMIDRSFNRSWIGPVQEVIIYTSDQTTNRAGIEDNINLHYLVY